MTSTASSRGFDFLQECLILCFRLKRCVKNSVKSVIVYRLLHFTDPFLTYQMAQEVVIPKTHILGGAKLKIHIGH
jgi:hypothetical protein